MVDEPTCVDEKYSKTSPISLRCRLRRSSARFAMMPNATFISSSRRSRYSGSTSWLEYSDGSRPRKCTYSASSCSGSLTIMLGPLYEPTGPASLPLSCRESSSMRRMDLPRRETNSATDQPNVIGTACCPCVRPTCGVSASRSAMAQRDFSSAISEGRTTFCVTSLIRQDRAVSRMSTLVAPRWTRGAMSALTLVFITLTRARMLCRVFSSSR